MKIGTSQAGVPVLMTPRDRATHMHVIGGTGRGKSFFLEWLIRQDISDGNGVCLIDPEGTLYSRLLRWCETHGMDARRQIVLFDPSEAEWSFGFNPLYFGGVGPAATTNSVEALIAAIAQAWGGEDQDSMARLSRSLRVVLQTLSEAQLTLVESQYLMRSRDDSGLREFLVGQVQNPMTRVLWQEILALKPEVYFSQFESTLNRLTKFLFSPVVYNSVGQNERRIDFAALMDEGAVVLVNLARGGGGTGLSAQEAKLFGTLLVNDLLRKALQRSEDSQPFYVYIDEVAEFVNSDIGEILDRCRKRGVHLTLAHQHLGQLRDAGERIYRSVMTDAVTKVIFGGLTAADARELVEDLYTGHLDLAEPKVFRPMVTRYVTEWLESHSETKSSGLGSSSTTGSAVVDGYSVDDDGAEELLSRLASTSMGSGESSFAGTSYTRGTHEAKVPVIEWLAGDFRSLEEQIHRSMATLMNQGLRHAVVRLPNRPPVPILTPRVSEAVANDRRVAEFRQRALASTPFAIRSSEAGALIENRQRALLEEAMSVPPAPEPDDFLG